MKKYAKFVAETEAAIADNVRGGRLVHAITGLTAEAGEVSGVLQKALYKNSLAGFEENLLSEMGDVLWYLQLLCNVTGTTLESLADSNMKKLKERSK